MFYLLKWWCLKKQIPGFWNPRQSQENKSDISTCLKHKHWDLNGTTWNITNGNYWITRTNGIRMTKGDLLYPLVVSYKTMVNHLKLQMNIVVCLLRLGFTIATSRCNLQRAWVFILQVVVWMRMHIFDPSTPSFYLCPMMFVHQVQISWNPPICFLTHIIFGRFEPIFDDHHFENSVNHHFFWLISQFLSATSISRL